MQTAEPPAQPGPPAAAQHAAACHAVPPAVASAVIADHRRHLGRLLAVWTLDGCVDGQHSVVESDRPVVVEVLPTPREHLLLLRDEGWLDPCWRVRVIDGDAGALRTPWVFGTSYSVDGRTVRPTEWQLISEPGSAPPRSD